MSTDFLEQHARQLQREAQQTAERSAATPDDFWLNAAADNQRQAAREALRALELEYARESGELLDMRFSGPRANGSISLDAFLKIAEPLNKAWKAAAFRLRHGVVEGRIGQGIGATLNLKLAGIAQGSTHILLTGNGSEDLSGESLFRETLTQTFRLLSSNNDDFYDAVDAMGGRAAHYVGEALKAIDAAGLAAQFTWQNRGALNCWNGSTDEVLRIRALLAGVSDSKTYEETISGSVAGIFDNGRLDIRTEVGKVRIRFPLDMIPVVQRFQIAAHADIRVQTTRFSDPISRRDVVTYQMLPTEK
ncbi:hypothetical protein RBA41_24320 [Massilia sp. CCM 9210]|uniref:hypothetical protein n=1 Tax=Massilia scottii TaxID=3057166 RepID=UPI002796CDC9|nr:hypothetical protein [Massilia sp. CCM 9210]MDQ1816428.1 hypothetical protein [Massilia sp. CCM 9210]